MFRARAAVTAITAVAAATHLNPRAAAAAQPTAAAAAAASLHPAAAPATDATAAAAVRCQLDRSIIAMPPYHYRGGDGSGSGSGTVGVESKRRGEGREARGEPISQPSRQSFNQSQHGKHLQSLRKHPSMHKFVCRPTRCTCTHIACAAAIGRLSSLSLSFLHSLLSSPLLSPPPYGSSVWKSGDGGGTASIYCTH